MTFRVHVRVMPRDGLLDPLCDLIMGETAENVAERYGVSREDQDRFSLRSHQRAVAALAAGRFDEETVPVPVEEVVYEPHHLAELPLHHGAGLLDFLLTAAREGRSEVALGYTTRNGEELGNFTMFADVDEDTLLVTPESIEAAVTPATAELIESLSGGSTFVADDLSDPDRVAWSLGLRSAP